MLITEFGRHFSKLQSLPILQHLSPPVNHLPSEESLESSLQCQRLAFRAVKEVAGLMTPGWTEQQAAEMVQTYLSDSGVKTFFHYPFAWFGERSKFAAMKNYREAMPTTRKLRENEVFILDVAPIYQNHSSDVGYTSCAGKNHELDLAMKFLKELRSDIPTLINGKRNGAGIWKEIERRIKEAGYEPIFDRYPYGVLGHRVYTTSESGPRLRYLNMGWQSYWNFLSRGVMGQLLTQTHTGDLTGLWAIEPHIATKDFGAKFEEILVIENGVAHWLETEIHKGWV
jgi:hypothetical protein